MRHVSYFWEWGAWERDGASTSSFFKNGAARTATQKHETGVLKSIHSWTWFQKLSFLDSQQTEPVRTDSLNNKKTFEDTPRIVSGWRWPQYLAWRWGAKGFGLFDTVQCESEPHLLKMLNMFSRPNIHVFKLGEEARVPGDNLSMHRENSMQKDLRLWF